MTLLIFFIILSILIVVHELGHFIAAKKAKVRVEVFSLGFGKKIFSRKSGDTEYTVSALPFGGYIKMAGDNTEDAKGAPDEFLAASIVKRFRIIFFGPLFNYLLGILLFWVVFVAGYSRLTPAVGTVLDGMGAQEAGIIAGDIITSIDNKSVSYWDDLQREVYLNRSKDVVQVGIERENRALSFPVRIKQRTVTTEIGRKRTVGLLGVTPQGSVVIVKADPAKALVLSIQRTYELTVLTYQALWSMVTGRLSLKDSVTGPLGMFAITSEMSKLGITAILSFIAILSISLGIFNLLPLPALDGGQIVLLAVEKLRRKPLSRKAEGVFNQAGFCFLILLAALVFVNDLVKFGYIQKAQDLFRKFFQG
ncbi:MAG: RIP metalloprotease RseP [Candidatus Omnitrophota bacterium]